MRTIRLIRTGYRHFSTTTWVRRTAVRVRHHLRSPSCTGYAAPTGVVRVDLRRSPGAFLFAPYRCFDRGAPAAAALFRLPDTLVVGYACVSSSQRTTCIRLAADEPSMSALSSSGITSIDSLSCQPSDEGRAPYFATRRCPDMARAMLTAQVASGTAIGELVHTLLCERPSN